jgi:hypothetical protein
VDSTETRINEKIHDLCASCAAKLSKVLEGTGRNVPLVEYQYVPVNPFQSSPGLQFNAPNLSGLSTVTVGLMTSESVVPPNFNVDNVMSLWNSSQALVNNEGI